MVKACVTGAAGFIGSHFCAYLKRRGYSVRGVDREPLNGVELDGAIVGDLTKRGTADEAVADMDEIYNFAAEIGGVGFITRNHALCATRNVLINCNMLGAARARGIKRFFFASSACAYNTRMQSETDARPLREDDAWPAFPEEGYGTEKLYSEQLTKYHREDYGLQTRVARFHNIYGPGTYDGGREKAPAAICRKVAEAEDGGEIVLWGDGQQRRSYMHVDDCVEGIYRLTQSDYADPVNLGTDRSVSVDELAAMVIAISGKKLSITHDTTKPQGVRGRNADISLAKRVLGWAPRVSLEDGLARLYEWVSQQIQRAKHG